MYKYAKENNFKLKLEKNNKKNLMQSKMITTKTFDCIRKKIKRKKIK